MNLAQAIQTQHEIKVYDSVFTCPRCDGKGNLREFSHIKNGVCFLCAGKKTIELKHQSKKVVEKKTQVVFKRELLCKPRSSERAVYESIEVWMNGKYGMESVYAVYIADENRQETRAMWKWFSENGAKMIVKDSTK